MYYFTHLLKKKLRYITISIILLFQNKAGFYLPCILDSGYNKIALCDIYLDFLISAECFLVAGPFSPGLLITQNCVYLTNQETSAEPWHRVEILQTVICYLR